MIGPEHVGCFIISTYNFLGLGYRIDFYFLQGKYESNNVGRVCAFNISSPWRIYKIIIHQMILYILSLQSKYFMHYIVILLISIARCEVPYIENAR